MPAKTRYRNNTSCELVPALLILGFAASYAIAAGQPIDNADQVTDEPSIGGTEDLLGDDLLDLGASVDLLFEEFDIVISASRSEQTSNLAPVPVSIISDEDIHYSGVGELQELFAFVPGFDILQLDKNRWSMGSRGLHQVFSDRTLFLMNGRNISSPVHGGVDMQLLPIFLEDIEQVEIVRGPGGAAWGANAFNGVVNIIEKDPRDTTGLMLSHRITEHGDSKTNMRYGASNEKFAWRVSTEYLNIDQSGSDYVILDPAANDTPSRPDDFRRSQKMAFSGVYSIDEETELDFGVGVTHVEQGDAPFLSLQTGNDERLDRVNAHVKLSKEFDPGRKGYIQWYGSYEDTERPSIWSTNGFDQSLDGQYSFEHGGNHTITVGGTARFINIDFDTERSTDILPAGGAEEQWIGAFIGDRWRIDEKWTLESQVRVDWYSGTELDWAGRAALLRSLGDDDAHVLRFALAKAFRTPQVGVRELETQRLPLGGGLFGLNVLPAGDLDNEQLYSIELGYSGKIRDGLTLRADAYYQIYEDLTGIVALPEPAPMVGRNFYIIDNIGGAQAWGFETELKHQYERMTASIWYAYNDFSFDIVAQNARAFEPARHKIGSTLRFQANDWLTLNANYRYSNTTVDKFTTDIPSHHRFDLTATFAIESMNAELQIGVTDLFDETDLRIFDQTATTIATETPGRALFAQFQMKF